MHKATVLVVDDEHTIRDTVCSYLQKEGYQVFTAADGLAAIQAFRSFSRTSSS